MSNKRLSTSEKKFRIPIETFKKIVKSKINLPEGEVSFSFDHWHKNLVIIVREK